MRCLSILVSVIVMCVPARAFVLQQPEISGLPIGTVSGWVVDANSWLGYGIRGQRHLSSTVGSAEAGTPLVILTDDGSIVYPVQTQMPSGTLASNRLLLPYANQRVTVSGKLVSRGKERGIVVQVVTADREPASGPTAPVREARDTTIRGTVTDLNSWLALGLSGPEHRSFAQARARMGQVLVLLGDDGGIYYPVATKMPSGPASTPALIDHAERTVLAFGTLIQRGPARALMIDFVIPPKPGRLDKPTDIAAEQRP